MSAQHPFTSDLDPATLKDADLLHVLQAAIYPNASVEALTLVMDYCKAAGLDPIQKPLQIIQVKDAQTGEQRPAVVPGIGLYRTIAARCGCAGVDEPEFGPEVTQTFADQSITFPSWCRVTVHRRLATGEIAHFTAKEFWRENVVSEPGDDGQSAPNSIWSKRPFGQLAKCAEAQALRKAFPEVGSQPVAEELEGKTLGAEPPSSRSAAAPISMPQVKPGAALSTRATPAPAGGGLTPAEAASVDLFPASTVSPVADELATAGELAYLCKRMVSKRLSIAAAREKAGIAPAETLDGLTKNQFTLLKEVLA